MEIKYVIVQDAERQVAFATSYQPLATTLADSSINTQLTLRVLHASVSHSFNLSKAMLEVAAFSAVKTWANILTALTNDPGLLNNYPVDTTLPREYYQTMDAVITVVPNPEAYKGGVRPLICSCEHHHSIECGYGSLTNPSYRGIERIKWLCPEVIFSPVQGKTLPVTFANCMPIVNGMAHRPVVSGGELYAVDSTKHLPSATLGALGLLLVDFTPLGGASFIPFSACDCGEDAYLTLPTGVSMAGKTALVVANHRLVLPNEVTDAYRVADDRTLWLNLRRLFTQEAMVAQLCTAKKYRSNTGIVNRVVMTDFLAPTSLMANSGNFIVLVNNSKVVSYTRRPTYSIYDNALKFKGEAYGLLMNQETGQVYDYTRLPGEDSTVVSFAPLPPVDMLIADHADYLDTPLGGTSVRPKYLGDDCHKHLHLASKFLVDIVGATS